MANREGVERPLSFSRICVICKEAKDSTQFNKHKGSKDGLQPKCRECNRVACRAYYYDNTDKIRQQRREELYGTTPEDLQAIIDAQRGVCALCEGSLEGSRQFNVDHCHVTQIVRGILCNRCNRALGFFDDDPARMRKAANYVERVYVSRGA